MIEVDVADYCQNCPEFEPVAEKAVLYSGEEHHADMAVRCKHKYRCKGMEKKIREKIENEGQQPEPEKEPEPVKAPEKQESKWTKWWKRLRNRLCWIDAWDVADAVIAVLAVVMVIFALLLLVLFSAGIIRLLLGI